MRDRQSPRPTTNSRGLDIAIIGRACRLPGANSAGELWNVLSEGRCTVSRIPRDRWPQEWLIHPRPKERGRSYTWAAGVLDDIWGFDPAVFGISPREAEQMDPQQRLLLELAWEALEDAGIRPSSLAGTETGVFVGGSTLDYGNLRLHDPAGADAYFATGNTLAVLSNRISYVFDLHGPSFTVDTACSSSFVALDAAVAAIQAGRIDTAIVGGVNILASPFGFISFSQATMLSPTGLCRAFSAHADGYVRAEGGIVLILRAASAAWAHGDRSHAMIAGSHINSDGRTSGISLPSKSYQAALLERAYLKHDFPPDALAFIEAHGTGTRVGDPVEAAAIGEVLGRRRSQPLPIGSIKTNIGHTEAASGLAGLFKAMLALEHDELPRSLHFDEPNPDIPFGDLNVSVSAAPVALSRKGKVRYAGISSLGFGGTNAHVILADPPPLERKGATSAPQFLLLSAHSRDSLANLAQQYCSLLSQIPSEETRRVIAATGHRRELLSERLVVPLDEHGALIDTLNETARSGGTAAKASTNTAVDRAAPVACVFSGNGGQWPGMGRTAYETNPVFRDQFAKIDRIFRSFANCSLTEAMLSSSIALKLEKTSVAQPLIFAIQVATIRCLARLGIAPDMVLGHSVGEIAAAEAAGMLDLESAIRVIYFRSRHQELGRDTGGMAVAFGPQDVIEALVNEIEGLTIAAHNSPRSFTLSGPFSALDQATKRGRACKVRIRRLDLAYPFHSELMKPAEVPLIADLECLQPKPSQLCFLSTVEGGIVDGPSLGARYWWRNVREPVRFMQTVQLAMRLGARVFIEIGPSPVLVADIRKIAEESVPSVATLCVLDQKESPVDPFRQAAAQAISLGARIDAKIAFGEDPGPVPNLPAYAWRRNPYRLAETTEATGWMRPRPVHPLIGARLSSDSLEWRGQLDPVLVPALADHRIDGQVLLPGAAFAEMALAVARDWLGSETAMIKDLEIAQPMLFSATASREILCRATPGTATVEIMSRARLNDSPWTVHAKAKVIFKPAPLAAHDAVPVLTGNIVTGGDLYMIARRSGLEFGPAYRQVLAASRTGATQIVVDLLAVDLSPQYGLDPALLDSCFHGLILLFSDKTSNARPSAYLPVRFGEIRLEKPEGVIARARIDVRRHDARAIVADFTLVDTDGALIAQLQGARFQAVRRELLDLASRSLVQSAILADEPTANRRDPALSLDTLSAAVAPETAAASESIPPAVTLIEGWATAAAYRFARALAAGGKIDPDRLVAEGRIPPTRRIWFHNLLLALEKSGLLGGGPEQFVLAGELTLPDPAPILQNIAAEYPCRSAELLLAARCTAAMEALSLGEEPAPIAESAIESFETGSTPVAAAAELLASVLRRTVKSWPRDRALRILQIGHGPLSRHAMALMQSRDARLTIHEPDPRRLERARLAFAGNPCIGFADSLEQVAKNSIDLIIAADALHRLASGKDRLALLIDTMAPGGLIAAIEPAPSLFRDLVYGLRESPSAATDCSDGFFLPPDWTAQFSAMPLRGIAFKNVMTEAGPARFIVGERPAFAVSRKLPGKVLIVGQEDPQQFEAASALSNWLEDAGVDCAITRERAFDRLSAEDSQTIVFLAPAVSRSGITAATIAQRCLALKNWAAELGKNKHQIWIECPGALRRESGTVDPVQTGLWSFARTFANEYQTLDVRRVDTHPSMPALVRARRLADVLLSGSEETELILDADSTRVVRMLSSNAANSRTMKRAPPASRLEKGDGTGLDRIRWVPVERQSPLPGQVEIAVAATGLNFRDVMWGLSVLPDEMLEDGLAGPALGLECAGRIVATAENVEGLQPGDAVLAVAGGAFATHVTVDTKMVAKVPDGLPLEAAATIPVAFLTAYYALITCAQLKRGEWVLIHGGAGGVGLAALQIARWRGARIIATASSAEKRDLVAALGAEHVFDARANAFVDNVRRVTGKGVAVVLNSLSGEAMELSMALLHPFGRFVELGKRDFLTNTHIGLRPFRNNLTYFGVDLDQLMLVQPDTSQQLFREVLERFAEGEFSPLPYRSFKAFEFIDAIRLMQQSGHIGKIVITPPEPDEIAIMPRREFRPAPDKTHLITGGCGGFGLATARWFAEHGARHLVLAGRSGAGSPEAQEAIADLRAAGVNVHVEALDIADADKVKKLLTKIVRLMPPLSGVIHAAAVLDDALIANLDAEKLKKVLAPKVTGAENLDRLTRDLPLDYFVLFSSATTAIGNPGQGNYVAANGFLEGLARQRRAAGLPGLAIAWGGIEDVGLLARNRLVKDILAALAGIKTMGAGDALNLMAEALAHPSVESGEAVLVISEMNWSTARAHLPLLQSPTFSGLARTNEAAATKNRAKLDIRALASTGSTEEARKQIVGIIVEEIAHILRLPQETVNKGKPLADIGVDSLMAVELAAALENRLTLEVPLSTSASGFNANELADHILGLCISPTTEDDSIAQGLAERHLGKGLDPAALETLTALVEERSRDLTQILR
jgi:phthiocerol/phenolphthiocerol synthesis type-I polyketide synthase C